MYFCSGFTLFNITPSRSIKVWYRLKGLLLFWGCVVLRSLCVCWSAGYLWLGWLHLGYCEQCWNDHGTGEHSYLFTSFLRDDLPYPKEISDSLCSQGNSEPLPSPLLSAGITGHAPHLVIRSSQGGAQEFGPLGKHPPSYMACLLFFILISFFWMYSWWRITGSHGNSVLSLMTDLHSVFHNGCANVHPSPTIISGVISHSSRAMGISFWF